jgi:hypothetical protein
MLRSWTIRLLLVTLACGLAACDEDVPTAPTNVSPPVTETFSGAISQNGVTIQSFTTSRSGTVTATLKEVAPDSALVVGFSLGNWTGTACQVVLDNNAATGGAVLSGTIQGVGNLCLRMYDVGNIVAPTSANYTVEIVHP